MIIWILIPEAFFFFSTASRLYMQTNTSHLLFAQQPVKLITHTYLKIHKHIFAYQFHDHRFYYCSFFFVCLFWNPHVVTRLIWHLTRVWNPEFICRRGIQSDIAIKSCKLHRRHASDEALMDLSLVRKSLVTFSLNPLCPLCMLHAELCSGVQRNLSVEPFVSHQFCSCELLVMRTSDLQLIKNSPQVKQIIKNMWPCVSLSELNR